jgi:hypothetical protein
MAAGLAEQSAVPDIVPSPSSKGDQNSGRFWDGCGDAFDRPDTEAGTADEAGVPNSRRWDDDAVATRTNSSDKRGAGGTGFCRIARVNGPKYDCRSNGAGSSATRLPNRTNSDPLALVYKSLTEAVDRRVASGIPDRLGMRRGGGLPDRVLDLRDKRRVACLLLLRHQDRPYDAIGAHLVSRDR